MPIQLNEKKYTLDDIIILHETTCIYGGIGCESDIEANYKYKTRALELFADINAYFDENTAKYYAENPGHAC